MRDRTNSIPPGSPRARRFPILSGIHRSSRAIGRHLEAPCIAEGVRPAEGHILSYLRSYGPCPVGALLSVFGHKPSTVTSMLTRLVERGLATRTPSADDRRVVLLDLTREGARAADRLRARLAALESEVRSEVKPRDLAGFQNVLAAIEAVARRNDETEEGP